MTNLFLSIYCWYCRIELLPLSSSLISSVGFCPPKRYWRTLTQWTKRMIWFCNSRKFVVFSLIKTKLEITVIKGWNTNERPEHRSHELKGQKFVVFSLIEIKLDRWVEPFRVFEHLWRKPKFEPFPLTLIPFDNLAKEAILVLLFLFKKIYNNALEIIKRNK